MLAVLRLLAVREVTSHATRSLLTGAGVAIGCAVVVAVLALNHSVLDGFQGMVNTLAGGADLQVRGGQAGVPADLVDKVAQDPAVAAAGAIGNAAAGRDLSIELGRHFSQAVCPEQGENAQ